MEETNQFFCTICNVAFLHSKNLYRHQRVQHANDVSDPGPSSINSHQKDEINQISCNISNISFSQRKHLYRHLRVQHNDQPFYTYKNSRQSIPCNICEKPFFTKPLLVRHLKQAHNLQHAYLTHSRLICPMSGCSNRSRNYCLLRTHLEEMHDFTTATCVEELSFNCATGICICS